MGAKECSASAAIWLAHRTRYSRGSPPRRGSSTSGTAKRLLLLPGMQTGPRRGPVCIPGRSRRRFAVPEVDEPLRGGDPLEYRVRCANQMAADAEHSFAPIVVRDADHQKAGTIVSHVADVVMRQRRCARSQTETNAARHCGAAAPCRATTGVEGLPCPPTGYVLWAPGIRAKRTRSYERDLRPIVGARRRQPAG